MSKPIILQDGGLTVHAARHGLFIVVYGDSPIYLRSNQRDTLKTVYPHIGDAEARARSLNNRFSTTLFRVVTLDNLMSVIDTPPQC